MDDIKQEVAEQEQDPVDRAYLQKIEELEQRIRDQQKEIDRANAAFKNLLENREPTSAADEEEDLVLQNIKRLIKR